MTQRTWQVVAPVWEDGRCEGLCKRRRSWSVVVIGLGESISKAEAADEEMNEQMYACKYRTRRMIARAMHHRGRKRAHAHLNLLCMQIEVLCIHPSSPCYAD
eukprot:1808987-Pleurochrysis_carterae.AAC.1